VRQLQNLALQKIRKLMTKNETQLSLEEVEQEERLRKRMEILREFFESKSTRKNGKN
jgi:RNA polymerase primary sigma factor